MIQKLSRAMLLATSLTLAAGEAAAYPVDANFVVIPNQSPLTVGAKATFIFTFSDSDTHNLSGLVSATFDLGASGAFPNQAAMTINSSSVTHTEPFVLDLGPEHAVATGLVADVSTLTPPATLTRDLGQAGLVYNFDASDFLITLVGGTVVATGVANETIDLETRDPPLSGSAEAGTLGSVTFTTAGASGPYTAVSATLRMPIAVKTTVPIGGINVDLDLSGTVTAFSKFSVALSPIPGDFDEDGDVDDADFTRWERGFGEAGATVGSGDSDGDGDADGGDFLAWQRNYGLSPPLIPAQSVPEPGTLALAILANLASAAFVGAGCRRRGSRRFSP